jgi:MFS family permease
MMFFIVGGGIDTVSVFLNALAVSEGWSRKALSAGISVGVICAGLFTPVVGFLVDRYGVRVPITLGIVLLGLGCIVLVSMTEPWHYAAANVLLGPGFASAAMLPITVAVTVRVPNRTALALGIVGVGASAGALIMAPLFQVAVDALGWRGAYGIMTALIVLPPVPFLLFALPRGRLQRASPTGADPPGPKLSLVQDLRSRGVGPLFGILVIPGLVSFGVGVHLVPYLTDVGHAATFAAAALGAAIGISAIGKLGGGWLGDRIGVLGTFRAALLLKACAVALLPFAGSTFVAGLFVVGHGLSMGAEVAVVPVIAVAILGRERFATLFGLLQLGSTLAIGLAPIVPGVIFDSTGSYQGAVLFWLAAMVCAIAVAFRLRLPGPVLDEEVEPVLAAQERSA